MFEFKYAVGDAVELKLSAEKGEVIGRAEYANSENSYYVRYLAADGRQVEEWVRESSLK